MFHFKTEKKNCSFVRDLIAFSFTVRPPHVRCIRVFICDFLYVMIVLVYVECEYVSRSYVSFSSFFIALLKLYS